MPTRELLEAIALRALCPPLWAARTLARVPPFNHPDILLYVPTDSKAVALTLDDGPAPAPTGDGRTPTLTGDVLDLLRENKAHATFFLLGKAAQSEPEILARIADEGHELGNHTWCDESSAGLPRKEFRQKLADTHTLLSASGRPVQTFRPGGGWPGWCGQVATIAKERHDYTCVLASLYPNDVRFRAPAKVFANAVLRAVDRGSIIVLHEGATPFGQPARERVLEILGLLLPELGRRCYDVVTVSELLERRRPG
jgi:peptidoglycan-N-acetylglucosamine deacetylase